jgi:hypothetical protein
MAARPRARRILIIAGVLIAALAVRVWEVQRTGDYRPVNDAGSYLTLASEIAHTGDYAGAPGREAPSVPRPTFPRAFPTCSRPSI